MSDANGCPTIGASAIPDWKFPATSPVLKHLFSSRKSDNGVTYEAMHVPPVFYKGVRFVPEGESLGEALDVECARSNSWQREIIGFLSLSDDAAWLRPFLGDMSGAWFFRTGGFMELYLSRIFKEVNRERCRLDENEFLGILDRLMGSDHYFIPPSISFHEENPSWKGHLSKEALEMLEELKSNPPRVQSNDEWGHVEWKVRP
jgi:hypothetical protein